MIMIVRTVPSPENFEKARRYTNAERNFDAGITFTLNGFGHDQNEHTSRLVKTKMDRWLEWSQLQFLEFSKAYGGIFNARTAAEAGAPSIV